MTPTLSLEQIQKGQSVQVRLTSPARVLVEELFLALDPWTRLRGLLARPPLQAAQGLLLRPCNGVHTFFMGFSIDVLFLDRDGQVLALRSELKPWRLTPLIGGAYCALELAVGRIAACRVTVGDGLSFVALER